MTHNKILLVDDEPALREMVGDYLAAQGFEVLRAEGCAAALAAVQGFAPDAAILDIMLADGDGFTLFERLRVLCPALPVLFLSARDEDAARLRGLGLGADDYITKPFLLQELCLRLNAVLRRVYGEAQKQSMAQIGGVTVNWDSACILRADGTQEAMTAKEYALLKKLWDNRGKIVTVDALCQTLWDGEIIGYENTLMVHISRLRAKIEPQPSHPVHLLTMRGLGYKLVTEKTEGEK